MSVIIVVGLSEPCFPVLILDLVLWRTTYLGVKLVHLFVFWVFCGEFGILGGFPPEDTWN